MTTPSERTKAVLAMQQAALDASDVLAKSSKHRSGFGGLLNVAWLVYGLWSVGVAASVFLFLVSKGVDLLGMPPWAWTFAALASAAAVVLYFTAHKLGLMNRDVAALSAACALFTVMILPMCMIMGFGAVEAVRPSPDTLGAAFEKMQHIASHAIAWVALVGSPAIAALANGFVVLSHQREAS